MIVNQMINQLIDANFMFSCLKTILLLPVLEHKFTIK